MPSTNGHGPKRAVLWAIVSLSAQAGVHRARGCALRSLNDRGDGTPEGDLTDAILDQLAKYERAKIAERSRGGIYHLSHAADLQPPRRKPALRRKVLEPASTFARP